MKTVVGLFRNFGEAEDAMSELTRLGLPEQGIGLMSSAGTSEAAKPPSPMKLLDLPDLGKVAANDPMLRILDAPGLTKGTEGMLGALVKIGLARNEALQCVDGIKHGGTLEAVVIEDDKEAAAVAIMRRHSGEGSVETEGELSSAPAAEAGIGETAGTTEERTLREKISDKLEGKRPEGKPEAEIVIPIVEEELRIAKEPIESGGVRVETRVASVPFDKTVTLREEHVNVERRVVDREIDPGDEAFRERSFDLTASAEQPIITKRARVVEEIRVHKDSTERVERIHDTLRHTDVQVSEIPTEARLGGGFESSRYLDHFKQHYEPQRYTFDWVAPAYEFGERLRMRSSESDWSKVEGNARSMWEGKNPGTWERFREAIKHAWERGGT